MTIILDVMTSKVILISSIFVVVGMLLYLSLKFVEITDARVVAAITRIGMDAMIIGVAVISMYTLVYIFIG